MKQVILALGLIGWLSIHRVPTAFAAALTLNGQGTGGCVAVDGKPPGSLIRFDGTGFTPNAPVTIRGTSDQGDTFDFIPPTNANAQGQIVAFATFWISENQTDTWVAQDANGDVFTLVLRAVLDNSCPATPLPSATPSLTPTPTRTPTVTPTYTPTPKGIPARTVFLPLIARLRLAGW